MVKLERKIIDFLTPILWPSTMAHLGSLGTNQPLKKTSSFLFLFSNSVAKVCKIDWVIFFVILKHPAN